MEVAEGFTAEVSVFEGVDVGDMDTSSRYKGVELVSGVRERAKELSEIQGEGAVQS